VLPSADPNAGAYLANVASVGGPVLAVLLGGLAMFALGLADDRRALGPTSKLVVQIAIAAAVCLSGVNASAFLPAPVGLLLSIGWILVITNAFNLLDNSDGLSSGVACVTALGFAAISLLSGEWLLTATWCALGGATFGFWRWNFWRGTPFLGDGGALLIGFLFGALSLRTTYYSPGVPTGLPVLTPLVLLAVPLFDTLSVIHIRWRAGKPIMQGDRNHFSHRLEAIGFSRRGAVVAHYLLVVQMILASWALRYLPAGPAVGLLGVVGLQLLMLYQLEMRVVARAVAKEEEGRG
jgi:UDP-GlcNAc:undecaprenyl-phosphate GlcNAc-1-phosphate transferase